MCKRFLTIITALLLTIPAFSQNAARSLAPEVNVEFNASGKNRNFYTLDMQALNEQQCGNALRAFYNARTFTVTSTLLEGNKLRVSAEKKVSQAEIESEIRTMIKNSEVNANQASGKEQMLKFKQKN